MFNDAISALGLVELPLKGKRFTWLNKQRSLLERLDWFFTSSSWTLTYPNTFVTPLTMETSDHTPSAISISTSIPKQHIFRFEIFLLQHRDFYEIVQQNWSLPSYHSDPAKAITAKFKRLSGLEKLEEYYFKSEGYNCQC